VTLSSEGQPQPPNFSSKTTPSTEAPSSMEALLHQSFKCLLTTASVSTGGRLPKSLFSYGEGGREEEWQNAAEPVWE